MVVRSVVRACPLCAGEADGLAVPGRLITSDRRNLHRNKPARRYDSS
jgi:hypothetical protein